MNNMIWTCNITQYLISVHYTYHASLYIWEICTLYMIHIVQVKHPLHKFTDKKLYKNINIKRDITLVGNCHFATGCLHDYSHFTIYHIQLHVWCSEAQAISAISPKTCTLKLQLLHNMKWPTKWSGHVKMIDPPQEILPTKDLLPERVTI